MIGIALQLNSVIYPGRRLPDPCVMSEITLDFLQSLLKDEYPDVSLQHFEVGVVVISIRTKKYKLLLILDETTQIKP